MAYLASSILGLAVIIGVVAVVWYQTVHNGPTSFMMDLSRQTEKADSIHATQPTTPRPTPTYQAPFGFTAEPGAEDIFPDSYIFYLAPGYSVEDVGKTIGIDLQPYVEHVSRMPKDSSVVFSVKGCDEALLTAIRSDRGVTLVEPNGRPTLP